MKRTILLFGFLAASFILHAEEAVDMFTWTGAGDMLSWSDPDNWDSTAPGEFPDDMLDVVTIGAGMTVTLDVTTGIKALFLEGGTLTTTTHMLMISDGMTWTGGILDVDVALLGGSMSGMVMAGTKTLKKILDVKPGATLTWDAGLFHIEEGAELVIDGEFGISFDGTLTKTTPVGGKISNMGVFVKAAGMGVLYVEVEVENAGVISVASGSVIFETGGVTNSGDIDVADGAEAEFRGGSTFLAMASFGGTGTVVFTGSELHDLAIDYSGPQLFVFAADEIVIDGTWVLTDFFRIEDGVVHGVGSITVSDELLWKGGTIDLAISIEGSSILDLTTAADKVLEGTLLNEGTTTMWTGDLIIINDGEFINDGIFDIKGSFDINGYVSEAKGLFINDGVFTKSGGVETEIHIPFSSSGTVTVSSDEIEFHDDSSFSAGTITVESGKQIDFFDSATFGPGVSIVGPGLLEFIGGTSTVETTSVGELEWYLSGGILDIDAIITPSTFDVDVGSGTLNINEPIDPTTLSFVQTGGSVFFNATVEPANSTVSFSGGTLDGSGELKVADSFSWGSGIIDLEVTCSASCSFSMGGSGAKSLTGTLNLNGTGNWVSGDFSIGVGGLLNIGGTYTAASTGNITGAGSIANGGTFRKSGGSALSVGPSMANTGIIGGIGSITFSGGLTNTDGTVAPGLSPGLLTLLGDFTNGTRLDIEIEDDTGAGLGHDQLVVTNDVSLGGELRVTETGMAPAPNGDYTILICQGMSPCITGDFATTDLPAGYSYVVNPTSVVLTKAPLPVELVSFGAKRQDQVVQLDWQTSSEINNAYFDIERSIDGRSFESIGQVRGQGNTTQMTTYSFIDQAPSLSTVENYYRLRQVDFDGSFTFSEIVVVTWEKGGQLLEIANWYQSDSQQLLVTLSGNDPEAGTLLTLYSFSGQLVTTYAWGNGQRQGIMPLPNLSSGMYVLRVADGKQQTTRQVFIR